MMIRELLNPRPAEVTWITRPRRFGKTLNMSMIKCFLDMNNEGDHLFDGLRIMEEHAICEEHMHKYPVIHISLKDVNADNQNPDSNTLNSALATLKNTIGKVAMNYGFLEKSQRLEDSEKLLYQQLVTVSKDSNKSQFIMSNDILKASLQTLAGLLKKHYGIAPVPLIDEYDVPLNDAFNKGYYNEFVGIYRSLLSMALKDSDNVSFAVVTGCLKISKESIFTGLNNPKVRSVVDPGFNEFFGFDDEVSKMLNYYGLGEYHEKVKKFRAVGVNHK